MRIQLLYLYKNWIKMDIVIKETISLGTPLPTTKNNSNALYNLSI